METGGDMKETVINFTFLLTSISNMIGDLEKKSTPNRNKSHALSQPKAP